MAFTYDLKVVVSGRQVEVYKYKKSVWKAFKKQTSTDPKEPRQLNMFEQRRLRKQRAISSIHRTRTEIRRLINSNPELNKFLTLTFAENITDLTTSNRMFDRFVKRLTYKFPYLMYVAVFEFQKRGAVHYHLLCNLPYIEVGELASIWRHGFIKLRRTENVTNIGAYMSKYLGKEIDERTFGRKKFFRSQNLKQPIEFIGYRATQFIERHLTTLSPVYEKIFSSEWTGQIKYAAYTLNIEIDRLNPVMIG